MKKEKIIELTPMPYVGVHTDTREKYDYLMQIYELAGWNWAITNELPTQGNFWDNYKHETCVGIGAFKGLLKKEFQKGVFGYDPIVKDGEETYSQFYSTISLEDFFKQQNITKKTLEKIKDYYDLRY